MYFHFLYTLVQQYKEGVESLVLWKELHSLQLINFGKTPGGGLPYITDGDALRNFQKKPLKVTILGVAPANFIP